MSFELGVYSFGNTPRTAAGGYGATAQAIRDVLEAVHVAEEAGLDFFGFGEHHTRSMPLSSPTALVNAAAASTHRIGLGTTVTVLSTDEPIRVFQQIATAAAIAPGRIEAVAGRGSSDITFPHFDLDVSDYDMLYRSKLDLLLKLNGHDRVTWSGPHRRRPLNDTLVLPRPEQPLRIWLGTGGSPESVLRAVELGLPMFLGILDGTPEHWAQYGHAYHNAWVQAGHPAEGADIAVAVHGFVAQDNRQAKAIYLDHETRMFTEGMAEIGRTGPPPSGRAANYEPGGMVFVGGPNEIADRILHLHELLGHTRQILQMDVGGMPHTTFLKSIELLGTEVLPQMRHSNRHDANFNLTPTQSGQTAGRGRRTSSPARPALDADLSVRRGTPPDELEETCTESTTSISAVAPTSPQCAESALGARERSMAELGASGASKAAGCCEQQSGSAAAGALAAGIGQDQPRRRGHAGRHPHVAGITRRSPRAGLAPAASTMTDLHR